jgi:hypothetical protein
MKTLIVASLFSLSILDAQDVPPPPKPDDGPSMEVTMKYIQDKLNGLGRVGWAVTTRSPDGESKASVDHLVSAAVADGAKCTLSYRDQIRYPEVQTDMLARLSFGDVVNAVVQELQVPVFQLRITTASKTVHTHTRVTSKKIDGVQEIDFDDNAAAFYFQDGEAAGRMAKAIVRAVELCGGGDKDPFK